MNLKLLNLQLVDNDPPRLWDGGMQVQGDAHGGRVEPQILVKFRGMGGRQGVYIYIYNESINTLIHT